MCHQVLRTEKEATASALTLKGEDQVKASQTCTHASQGRRISWSAQDEEEEGGEEKERTRQRKRYAHASNYGGTGKGSSGKRLAELRKQAGRGV